MKKQYVKPSVQSRGSLVETTASRLDRLDLPISGITLTLPDEPD
ncbi:hypothetical protein [Nitratireductor sp. XY-223]|nr:hypothetical protein [Nitratireductor sp. XY-223]